MRYNYKEIVGYFNKLNKCIEDTMIKPKGGTSFSLKSGLNYSGFYIDHSSGFATKKTDFSNEPSFVAGLEGEFFLNQQQRMQFFLAE